MVFKNRVRQTDGKYTTLGIMEREKLNLFLGYYNLKYNVI